MVDSNNARESVFDVTFAVANLFLVHCSDPGCMGVQWPDRQRHDYLIDGIVPEESGQIFKIAVASTWDAEWRRRSKSVICLRCSNVLRSSDMI